MSTTNLPRSLHSVEAQVDMERGVGFLLRMALKMFGVVSKRFDRTTSTDQPSTSMDNTSTTMPSAVKQQNLTASAYQQSSTRRLAFGGSSDVEADKRPMDDFYNNSTLTNVTKVFCAAVLLCAFILVMSRSFKIDFPYLK